MEIRETLLTVVVAFLVCTPLVVGDEYTLMCKPEEIRKLLASGTGFSLCSASSVQARSDRLDIRPSPLVQRTVAARHRQIRLEAAVQESEVAGARTQDLRIKSPATATSVVDK